MRKPLLAKLAQQLRVCQLESEANRLAEDFANVIKDIGDLHKTTKERGAPSWSEVCSNPLCRSLVFDRLRRVG